MLSSMTMLIRTCAVETYPQRQAKEYKDRESSHDWTASKTLVTSSVSSVDCFFSQYLRLPLLKHKSFCSHCPFCLFILFLPCSLLFCNFVRHVRSRMRQFPCKSEFHRRHFSPTQPAQTKGKKDRIAFASCAR
jgi:hypothetical protein